jgi:Uma2 family endonuclease
MTAEMVAPAWMHAQISAEQYDSWSEEQCAGIEIVDGIVVVSPSASKRRNRLARILANALDTAAGPDWNADTDFDVRLQDVPLTNRRPDVVVYRAETIDLMPTRPEHVLLVVEVVSPGSETTDRIVKVDQYAKAGIPFYWRIEGRRSLPRHGRPRHCLTGTSREGRPRGTPVTPLSCQDPVIC